MCNLIGYSRSLNVTACFAEVKFDSVCKRWESLIGPDEYIKLSERDGCQGDEDD